MRNYEKSKRYFIAEDDKVCYTFRQIWPEGVMEGQDSRCYLIEKTDLCASNTLSTMQLFSDDDGARLVDIDSKDFVAFHGGRVSGNRAGLPLLRGMMALAQQYEADQERGEHLPSGALNGQPEAYSRTRCSKNGAEASAAARVGRPAASK
ncbi:hypothetical protein FACS1894186_2860 [Alphaproteobacteria bacterium]|nr:hypothetical protein FACS1894186_2860 [Alphaproteobacteria bacterium]